MTRLARTQCESNIYHVISRGAGRQIIFEDDLDRTAFLERLNSCLEGQTLELLCWCLMSNHFHLLLRGSINVVSDSMRTCCGQYAKRFNGRHGRSGHLFQERFRSEPVDTDAYLITVVRYIHQNPVAAGITASCEYEWSSYNHYIQGGGIIRCDTSFVLGVFGGKDSFVDAHKKMCREEECLEEAPNRKITLAMPESRAIEIANELLGEGAFETLKSKGVAERNDGIVKLFDGGLSIRRIERLTGISRSTVSRAIRQRCKMRA